METTIKTQQLKVRVVSTVPSLKAAAFWQRAEANRFGIMPMLLVIVACMGGIAAAFGAKDDVLKIGIVAFPTIIMLAFMLAVAPMRLIIWSAIAALLIQAAVLIF